MVRLRKFNFCWCRCRHECVKVNNFPICHRNDGVCTYLTFAFRERNKFGAIFAFSHSKWIDMGMGMACTVHTAQAHIYLFIAIPCFHICICFCYWFWTMANENVHRKPDKNKTLHMHACCAQGALTMTDYYNNIEDEKVFTLTIGSTFGKRLIWYWYWTSSTLTTTNSPRAANTNTIQPAIHRSSACIEKSSVTVSIWQANATKCREPKWKIYLYIGNGRNVCSQAGEHCDQCQHAGDE